MSQTKIDDSRDNKEPDQSASLESQYRDIGISAVVAAAVYTCKAAKPSKKT